MMVLIEILVWKYTLEKISLEVSNEKKEIQDVFTKAVEFIKAKQLNNNLFKCAPCRCIKF